MTQTVKDANTYGPGRGPGALALSDEQLAQLFCAHRMGVSTVPGDDAGRELLGMQPACNRPSSGQRTRPRSCSTWSRTGAW